ncbi:MAG: radical SAM protein [Candidatus Aminicenantaceae bacterium]
MSERIILNYPADKELDREDCDYILRGTDISFLIDKYKGYKNKFTIKGFDYTGNLNSKDWYSYFQDIPEEMFLMMHSEGKVNFSEIVEKLSKRKTEIILKSSDNEFRKKTQVWSKYNFQVKIILDHIEHNIPQIFKDLLDFYMHTPLINKRIFPFHFLMERYLAKREMSLLDYYLGFRNELYFVTDEKEIRSIFPDQRIPSFGTIEADIGNIRKEEKNFVKNYYEQLANKEKKCVSCPNFHLCGGFFLLFSDKKECSWLSFFDTLKEEMEYARKYFAEVKEKKEKERALKDATLFVSQKCVNNCVFCSVANKRKEQIPDYYSKVEKSLDNLLKANVRSISFSGAGETTLNPNLSELVRKARKRGVKEAIIFTNGYSMIEEKMEEFKERGVTGFLLSVHGFEKSHDQSVRREGSFKEILNFIDIWKKHSENIQLNINTCFTVFNLGDLNKIAGFSLRNYVRMHSICYPEWSGNVLNDPTNIPKYSDIYEALKSFKAYMFPHVYFDNIPRCFVPENVNINFLQKKDELLYDDIKVKKQIPKDSSLVYNRFLEFCKQIKCVHRNKCCGFDKNYLNHYGETELIDFIRKHVKGNKD